MLMIYDTYIEGIMGCHALLFSRSIRQEAKSAGHSTSVLYRTALLMLTVITFLLELLSELQLEYFLFQAVLTYWFTAWLSFTTDSGQAPMSYIASTRLPVATARFTGHRQPSRPLFLEPKPSRLFDYNFTNNFFGF